MVGEVDALSDTRPLGEARAEEEADTDGVADALPLAVGALRCVGAPLRDGERVA